MNILLRVLAAAAACSLLGACATASVLKADAASVQESTRAAVAASREFYGRLDASRRNYLLDVLGGAPNCRLDWNVRLMPDPSQPYGLRCLDDVEKAILADCEARPPGPACPADGLPSPLGNAQAYLLVGEEQGSALVLVDVMAQYQIALAQILEDPEFDASGPLLELHATARSADQLIKALEGDAKAAPFDYRDQVSAVAALIELIARTAEDRRDLAALRNALGAADGPGAKFEAALDRLIARYGNLDRNLLVLLDRAQIESQRRELNARLGKLAADKRADAMRPIANAYAEHRRRAASPDALTESFTALRDNQRTLRAAVVDGEATADQRRRIAAASLGQLRAWFDAVRSLVTVF